MTQICARTMRRRARQAILMLSVAGFGASASADVIGQWHFDEEPGVLVAAEVVQGNDAALSGSAEFVAGGVSGNALHIETVGNGFANIGNHYALTNVDYSLVIWVRTAPGDTQSYFPMGRHHSGTANGFLIGINPSGPYAEPTRAWFYDSDSPSGIAMSTTPVTDGKWHQIVATHDADGDSLIYVDGAPVEALRPSGGSNGNGAPCMFGGILVGSTLTSVMNGWVDEAQIYDHILQPCDVEFLYANPALIVEENPCPADLNGSGVVDVNDLLSLLAQWGNTDGSADINCDLSVDVDDLLALLSAWGPC